MKQAINRYKFVIPAALLVMFSMLSFQAHAGGSVIIIGGSNFDGHHFSRHGRSHRLRNKHFFDNRHRRGHEDRYYRNRHYRSNYYGDRSYRSNRYDGYGASGYNYGRSYRSNRYCPY